MLVIVGHYLIQQHRFLLLPILIDFDEEISVLICRKERNLNSKKMHLKDLEYFYLPNEGVGVRRTLL